MPKIQTNAQHDYRFETIARAEGDECIVCHIEHFVRRRRISKKLEIDHADSDRTNWAWSNLHLVCHKHNCRLRNMDEAEHISFMRSYGARLEKERARAGLPTWKTVLKDMIDYERASAEIQLNRNYKPRWLRYVIALLQEHGSFKKTQLIRNAANEAKCSKQTSENYLFVECADDGILKETIDGDGEKIIVFRLIPVREPIRRTVKKKVENKNA